jgi:hypothetical protein
MAKVYYTDQGWCCVVGKAVSYYKDFCQAMDAAYRQTRSARQLPLICKERQCSWNAPGKYGRAAQTSAPKLDEHKRQRGRKK